MTDIIKKLLLESLNEKWTKKYKKSINCSNPKGFSQKAHCAARKKRKKGLPTKSKSPFNENVNDMKTITDFKSLYNDAPAELKKIINDQWKAPQNLEWHPEGNTLKHIIYVVRRAISNHPNDPDMIMAAFFHDLGKYETLGTNPKTGQPTAYGHEFISADLVKKYSDWVASYGADPENVYYIVKNHMKVKPRTWDKMRDVKKEPIVKHPSFDKLNSFTKLDVGGNIVESHIKSVIREYVKNK